MGKEWDNESVAFSETLWREVLRVLKPGGHLVAMGGTRAYHRLAVAIENAGFEVRDSIGHLGIHGWVHGQGFPKGKSQLKPAWEPIILARKPLAGTVAQNVLAHGTGGLNIDATRIGYASDADLAFTQRTSPPGAPVFTNSKYGANRPEGIVNPTGRWPANVVLDEEAARLLDEQSGERKTTGTYARSIAVTNAIYGRGRSDAPAGGVQNGYGDTGGASRFLYTAKASRAERGAFNSHPCVKPLALMQWLVRLVTPPGGRVLDPFLGSGTTALACQREGFDCIGIERDEHSVEIAVRRLSEGADMFTDVTVTA